MEQDFRVCRICYVLILCLASSSIAILTTPAPAPTTQSTSPTPTEQKTTNNSAGPNNTFHETGETATQTANYNSSSTTDLTKTSKPITSATKEKPESQTHDSNKTEQEKNNSGSDTKIVIIFFTIFIIIIVIISVIIILKKKNKKTSYSFEAKCKSTDDTEIPLGNMKE